MNQLDQRVLDYAIDAATNHGKYGRVISVSGVARSLSVTEKAAEAVIDRLTSAGKLKVHGPGTWWPASIPRVYL